MSFGMCVGEIPTIPLSLIKSHSSAARAHITYIAFTLARVRAVTEAMSTGSPYLFNQMATQNKEMATIMSMFKSPSLASTREHCHKDIRRQDYKGTRERRGKVRKGQLTFEKRWSRDNNRCTCTCGEWLMGGAWCRLFVLRKFCTCTCRWYCVVKVGCIASIHVAARQ